jgi:hypothetical protein
MQLSEAPNMMPLAVNVLYCSIGDDEVPAAYRVNLGGRKVTAVAGGLGHTCK